MTPARSLWKVRLSAAAASDYSAIACWTREQFGAGQARTYAELLDDVQRTAHRPNTPGARPLMDLLEGFFTLHASRTQRKARHLIGQKKAHPTTQNRSAVRRCTRYSTSGIFFLGVQSGNTNRPCRYNSAAAAFKSVARTTCRVRAAIWTSP